MTDSLPGGRFEGLVYRAHNPRWACAPTSGEGAARHGGRFNRPGIPALYTSLDPRTAWMEAQQGMPFKAQPMTLVAYRVDCEWIIDLTAPRILTRLAIGDSVLACPWEDLASTGETPPTWCLADDLISRGAQGILVPSFAPGTTPAERNLVLWRWCDTSTCRVEAIDDLARLPRNGASWG